MAYYSLLSLLLSCTLLQPLFSAANLRHTASLLRSHPLSEAATSAIAPTTYFEVTKPIPLPKTKPFSYFLLQHDFASTYGKPPVLADYKPPSNFPSRNFSRIVLEWTATSKGRQFDRIFGVWLGGVEILRSCTAEPRPTGIIWTVKKDITKYHSLLKKDQTVAVYIGNIVDSTYTGVYHVNLTFHFYPAQENHPVQNRVATSAETGHGPDSGSGADLILPISRNLPLNDGLWFLVENSTDVEGKELSIPLNAYRAVLEVYVSFHENDEFWYSNYPNEYISLNNLTDTPGNGPFREVIVSLDDSVVGAVWPFTVIYTGGVIPYLWRPISAIGSFDLPSYDIEITPFLGKLLDGKKHTFAFSVTNGLNVWYIDANLHLWLDNKRNKTQGKLLKHSVRPLSLSSSSNLTGSDGKFVTNVTRSIISSGWVKSSHGVITTNSRQEFKYSNAMVLKNDGDLQILDQVISYKGSVGTKTPLSWGRKAKVFSKFRTYLYGESVDKGNGTTSFTGDVKLSVDERSRKSSGLGSSSVSRLKNSQKGHGVMVVKDHSLAGGVGSTRQDYRYYGDKLCYSRNVRSSNYTILHDKESNSCKHSIF